MELPGIHIGPRVRPLNIYCCGHLGISLRPAATLKQVLAENAAFLAEQQNNERLRLLLVNGMTLIALVA